MENQAQPGQKKEEKEDSPIVRLDAEAIHLLSKAAKKAKVSKGKYASAAIAYFAATGLDPTKEQPKGLANVSIKVDEVERNVRTQNHEIGTRLIQIIRTWEKNLYTFLQQQQAATYNYMELIESNILQHQVLVESNTLAPMVEALFKSNIEAFITRTFASHLFIKSAGLTPDTVPKQLEQSNAERDIQLTNQMREHLKTNSVPLPKPTQRRAITPAPTKPVAAASPPPAVPPKS